MKHARENEEACAYDMLGPTCLLLSFTKAYAACMPVSCQTSGGTEGERVAAARMTRAMTRVAERETPHWQLGGVRGGGGEGERGRTG